MRQARNEAGERLFEREELLAILDVVNEKPISVADELKPVKLPQCHIMRSMIQLGIKCGFGNTDCSSLPRTAVNLETGWIVFPRPKTGIIRKIPLWSETIESLKLALPLRRAPIDPDDEGLFFLTERGTRLVRMQPRGTEARSVTINDIGRRFESILKKRKLDGQKPVLR